MNRLALMTAPWAVAAGGLVVAYIAHQNAREARASLAECAAYVAATGDADDAIHSLPADPDDLREWLRGLATR